METNNNIPPYNYQEEEIDLREILSTISRYKNVIIGITLICILLAAIISFFVIKPTYEARAVLSISSLNKANNTIIREENDMAQIRDNVDDIIQLPEMSIQGYQELITSSILLENTKKKLKLDYSVDKLRKMIKIELPKEGNLIALTVTTGDPQLSAHIANTLTREVIDYVCTTNASKMNSFASMIEGQIQNEENILDKSVEQMQLRSGALTTSPSYKTEMERRRLESEISMRQNAIDLLNSKLVAIRIEQSIYMAENTITLVSPANPPENPARPNKPLNIAIAAVLGLMVSTMGVFLADYMKSETKEQ